MSVADAEKFKIAVSFWFGVMPDAELAELAGVSKFTIRDRRRRLGIVSFQNSLRSQWDHEAVGFWFGAMDDRELADLAGLTYKQVQRRREKVGVKGLWPHRRGGKFLDGVDFWLGAMADRELADLVMVHKATISKWRKRLGVRPFERPSQLRSNARWRATARRSNHGRTKR